MLKKLDKMILKRFLGPFFLTFGVVLFIFLTQYMIKNFKHFVGKGLDLEVYGELFFYFSVVLTPVALPLAVLLSSLMTFGSLGEHSELTAIKGAGISLLRILRPVAFLVVFVTIGAFYFNDQISPWANLKAYSLLYDIKQKKPVLEFKEEVFYTDMPNYRIKIGRKDKNDQLEDVVIYNHTDQRGNVQVILAEKGTMKTEGEYMFLKLRQGRIYSEESAKKRMPTHIEYFRQEFDSASFLFSLESYGLKETKEEFFRGHNLMKTTKELIVEKDSAYLNHDEYLENYRSSVYAFYTFWQPEERQRFQRRQLSRYKEQSDEPAGGTIAQQAAQAEKLDAKTMRTPGAGAAANTEATNMASEPRTVREAMKRKEAGELQTTSLQNDTTVKPALSSKSAKSDKAAGSLAGTAKKDRKNVADAAADSAALAQQKLLDEHADTLWLAKTNPETYSKSADRATSLLNSLISNADREDRQAKLMNNYYVDIHRKFTKTVAVFVMFLIGAPLGAIIKKGGLGVPVLVSIVFFVIFYISTIMGEKYAKEMVVSPAAGCWAANIILFAFALFFLKQARADARLFDLDYYYVIIRKLREYAAQRIPFFREKLSQV